MNPYKLCCNKQQAERLKELGIEQKSVFYKHPDWNNLKTDSELYDKYGISFKAVSISFFTVTELAAILPFGNFCVPIFDGEIAPESEVMYEVHLETWIQPNRFRTVLVGAEEWIYKNYSMQNEKNINPADFERDTCPLCENGELHSCPFDFEVNGNCEDKCTCCDYHTSECKEAI